MFKIDKPLPMPTEESAPFWEGTRRGELRAQRCDDCGHLRWPPAAICPICLSGRHEWVRLSGRGKVHSWIVVHKSQHPAFWGDPFNVAIVELDEGPRLHTNLVDVDLAAIRIGLPVEVAFDPQNDEITLPRFKPAA
ncbi:Zn-ribbon domain-containing OB-fold protein [bacterium]|nr:Zn-ribbon domain-containing OB-fold protein [bacterium]